ncbi:hypothetical protein DOM21_11310 [Bacteriovorax stolpii]|uniref:hypothetical protein n=1 Tax=Bacteriovorax stolpii TaxID=960 RepID=UPI00115B8E31|nr:hypothetical protein [Bacteriovorax stolpii]QDK42024.1 hypothetical protein DOM21_11310 [Bacteriovorax stolpii]
MKKIIGLLLMGILVSGCRDYEKIIGDAREHKKKVGKQVVDGEEEPPFPNESENNKTLRGVDVNQNGIRDDVDVWINYVGKDRNHRMALRQLTKKMQKIMDVGGGLSKESRDQVVKDVWDAKSCVFFFEKNKTSEEGAFMKVIRLLFNTNNRVNSYKSFHDRVLVYESNKKDGVSGKEHTLCEFEIENLHSVLEKNKKLGY